MKKSHAGKYGYLRGVSLLRMMPSKIYEQGEKSVYKYVSNDVKTEGVLWHKFLVNTTLACDSTINLH